MGKEERLKLELMLRSVFGDHYVIRKSSKKPGSITIPPEEFDKYEKIAHSIANDRGKILQLGIALENDLEGIIQLAMMGNAVSKTSPFVINSVLNRLSLRNKFDIFRDMTKSLEPLSKNDYKKLLNRIENLINLRNRFAHGDLVFEDEKVFLRYVQGGKRKEDLLTNNYFRRYEKLFRETFDDLQEITNVLLKFNE